MLTEDAAVAALPAGLTTAHPCPDPRLKTPHRSPPSAAGPRVAAPRAGHEAGTDAAPAYGSVLTPRNSLNPKEDAQSNKRNIQYIIHDL